MPILASAALYSSLNVKPIYFIDQNETQQIVKREIFNFSFYNFDSNAVQIVPIATLNAIPNASAVLYNASPYLPVCN